jgi:hypothetical protein
VLELVGTAAEFWQDLGLALLGGAVGIVLIGIPGAWVIVKVWKALGLRGIFEKERSDT